MSIDIRCDRCRRQYVLSDDKRGQRIWCKVCGNALTSEAKQVATETAIQSPPDPWQQARAAIRPAPMARKQNRANTLALIWTAVVLIGCGIGLTLILCFRPASSTSMSATVETRALPTLPAVPQVKMDDTNDIHFDRPADTFDFSGLPPSISRHLPTPSSAAAPLLQPPPTTPTGPWTDLLADLITEKQALSGQWTLDQGTLTCVSTKGFARLNLGPAPAPCYELEMTFNRRAGHKEFCILLPAGRPGQISLGGTGQSIQIQCDTHTAGSADNLILDNKEQVLDIVVRLYGDQAAIDVYLDAERYLQWAGPQSCLSNHFNAATDDPKAISLAVHSSDTIDFKDIKLRPLTQKSP